MAEVSARGYGSGANNVDYYFPSIPPRAPKAALSYAVSVSEAPLTALMGVVVDGKMPDRHPVTPRCRERSNVGKTNRWRLPESLGGDLLGTTQAVRAVNFPLNPSMLHIITAENPKSLVNLDVTKPYRFRVNPDRDSTLPQRSMTSVPRSRCVSRSQETSALTKPASRSGSLRPLSTFTPQSARPATHKDLFLYHSHGSKAHAGPPDLLLQCLDVNWELHRPFVRKSSALSQLILGAAAPSPHRYYKNKMSETLDNYVQRSNFYSNEYQQISQRLCTEDREGSEVKGVNHPQHYSEKRVNHMTVIRLDISDRLVTREALAIALGHLYHDRLEVETSYVAGVLAAACALQYPQLIKGCTDKMISTMSCQTVCEYYQAALQYGQESVVISCERWLELNLIPKLASQIQLRQVPISLLQKLLKSNRLFTYNEYSLYKMLIYWVFLQLNASIQLMPSFTTIFTYFNSLPKSSGLLEREEGEAFISLFKSLRLHGVTEIEHMKDIQQMNILPQAWVISILGDHYHGLQGGGDMGLLTNFNTAAVRQGFIIDNEPHYHSEILSLSGFHFELRAIKEVKSGAYTFFMQRLKPGDPILSFRQCERHTFSMRPDRDVRYCIRVQSVDQEGEYKMYTTGMLFQRFGLGSKTSKSQVVTLEGLRSPIHVTFAVLFPQS